MTASRDGDAGHQPLEADRVGTSVAVSAERVVGGRQLPEPARRQPTKASRDPGSGERRVAVAHSNPNGHRPPLQLLTDSKCVDAIAGPQHLVAPRGPERSEDRRATRTAPGVVAVLWVQ